MDGGRQGRAGNLGSMHTQCEWDEQREGRGEKEAVQVVLVVGAVAFNELVNVLDAGGRLLCSRPWYNTTPDHDLTH